MGGGKRDESVGERTKKGTDVHMQKDTKQFGVFFLGVKQLVLDSFKNPQWRQRQLQLDCSRQTALLQSACCCSGLKLV